MATQVPARNGGTLTRPEKGDRLNPYGRPKKLTSQILADLRKAGYERVGPSAVTEASEQLIGVSESVLRSIQKDPDQPVFMKILAEALLRKKGRFEAVNTVMDRAHGKAKQSVDLAATVTTPPVLNILVHSKPDGQ